VNRENDFLHRISGNPPRLIVVLGSEAGQVAAQRAGNIPLFFCLTRNATGVSLEVDAATQLSYFRRLIPDLSALGLFYIPNKSNAGAIEQARALCKQQKISLFPVPIGSADDVASALTLVGPLIQAFWLLPSDSLRPPDYVEIARLTKERNLPYLTTTSQVDFVRFVGMLFALVPDYRAMGRRSGEIVKQIEQGQLKLTALTPESPPVIPVINQTTATKINFSIPAAFEGPPARVVRQN